MAINPILVTKPTMPPLEEFIPYLQSIWHSKILTNGGPLHAQLEEALCEYLGINQIALFNNGTIALICALNSLGLTSGEVITTPYSFVATTHSLLWNNLTPVFVDIKSDSFNIDPQKIELAINDKTVAILPVHCYGHPCDVEIIQDIARRHNLKVIYDAAHAFGVHTHSDSLLNYGDLSVLSFHATKVFNTFEGGAIVCHDINMKSKINSWKNFGIKSEISIDALGMNGKMTEICAAFGLLQLKYIDTTFTRRQELNSYYKKHLTQVEGIGFIEGKDERISNYSYFPILIQDNYPLSRDELYEKLKMNHIYTRRYFFPLISDFSPYNVFPSAKKENLPIATKMSQQILCLPLYTELSRSEQNQIIDIISRSSG